MRKLFFATISFFLLVLLATAYHKTARSVPPVSIKDSLSSSQMSYFALLGAGNTYGDGVVRIAVSGTMGPSKTTNNLFVGDTVSIGAGSSLSNYVVKDIGDTSFFQVGVGLSANATTQGMAVIATRSAIHTVSFTPNYSFVGGHLQFLVKASNTAGETYNDGIPDMNGFDLGTLVNGAVTCPLSGTASVGTTAAITSGYPGTTNYYNVIDCALGAATPVTSGVGLSMVIGVGNSMLVNPTRSGVTEGNADVFTFFIRHLDNSSNEVVGDRAQGKIAVVEAVQVDATVDPTLTFTIDTVGMGTSACGVALKPDAYSAVTATQIPFGILGIGATHTLAQHLSVVTNGTSYVVTAFQQAPLTVYTDATGTTIPATTCDAGGCTSSLAAEWAGYSGGIGITAASSYGFGYSLQNINVGNSIFNYNNSGRTFNAVSFGIGASNAQAIMQRTSQPSTTEYAFVCYRLRINSVQKAGEYQGKIVYTATATF